MMMQVGVFAAASFGVQMLLGAVFVAPAIVVSAVCFVAVLLVGVVVVFGDGNVLVGKDADFVEVLTIDGSGFLQMVETAVV